MLNEKVQDGLNGQLKWEFYSSYLYLAMSAYFRSINLGGFASWMRVQAQEELVHAMKFFDHINDRNGKVILQPVDAPPSEWASPLAAFEDAYRHEQKVTALINDLVGLAGGERDNAASIFLQWFVTEQVEEEASADDVVQKLKLIRDDAGGLFMLDRDLAQRVFAMPATSGGAAE